MRKRLAKWFWRLLIAIDQVVHVWVAGWTYVWLDRGECPSPDETISSRVGRAAVDGRPWGLFLEKIIDRVAMWFGDGPNHCRRSIGS